MQRMLSFLGNYREWALLFLRVGLGICFFFYGYPKIMGGPAMWTKIGGVMKLVGIDFLPVVWGFMAAFSECIGGILIALGLFFRPACILLVITMGMATYHHFRAGDGFQGYGHALELAIIFLALLFIGPGKYSIDKK